ncbi:hypothetical protein ETB97_011847 [Aspergillus alliaceus]|uniref:Serine hydrolase domain-containing protein n=1 Tax=Petromyces alliaceus TaxID=209559 RepID=A0A8H6E8D3_PETAA|nr:hypothetical protein ETB97_011847 [Aspergillus burnettii]
MPPLRFLCLHGGGTNADIFRAQIGTLMSQLTEDQVVETYFSEGTVDSPPGPGIEGFFEGPYFLWYNWPPRVGSEVDSISITDAYHALYEVVEDEGPFDGVLGFSQGGSLAHAFQVQHLIHHPLKEPLFRCAIYLNSPMPLFVDDDGSVVYDMSVVGSPLKVPSLHVVSERDPNYEHCTRLCDCYDPAYASVIRHAYGHAIPKDTRTVTVVGKEIRELAQRILFHSE